MADTARDLLIMQNNLLHMHLKLFKKSNSKTAETTGDLIGNTVADETVTNGEENIGLGR